MHLVGIYILEYFIYICEYCENAFGYCSRVFIVHLMSTCRCISNNVVLSRERYCGFVLRTPPTTHSNQFQLFHDSSRQQYGVTVTRCCSYSCFVLLKMGDGDDRNLYSRCQINSVTCASCWNLYIRILHLYLTAFKTRSLRLLLFRACT